MVIERNRPIGLIAGWGRFPVYFAEEAKKKGLRIICIGIREEASKELASLADQFYWSGIGKMGGMIRRFQRHGCKNIVMAGKIHKARFLYRPWKYLKLLPDFRTARLLIRRRFLDNKDDSILLAMIEEYRKDGLDFASALDICPELLAEEGVLTSRQPTAQQRSDIAFGWYLAKEMGRLDVGQTVCVKERAVLSIEAIEGTDQAIRRAGELCKAGGFTVVKVAKPQQDRRFDVPTIGPETIASLKAARASVLAIEAGNTILLDREETLKLADAARIIIVSQSSEVLSKVA